MVNLRHFLLQFQHMNTDSSSELLRQFMPCHRLHGSNCNDLGEH